MNLCKLLLFLTTYIIWTTVIAQKKSLADTIFQMKEISIIGNKPLQLSPGNHIQEVDSSNLVKYSNGNLGDLLSQHANLQVNDQGGGLSTISMRGTGPSHTAFIWNGFNLQDILNGLVNLYLMPVDLFEDVKIQYGGSGALYGSGAIGGSIHLNSKQPLTHSIHADASFSAGSFSNYFKGCGFNINTNKYSGNIKFYNQSAKNDYPYRVIGFPDSLPKLKNANTNNTGLLIDQLFKLTNKQKVSLHFWYQQNNNEVPAPRGSFSTALKNDKSYRITADWSRITRTNELYLRTALFNTLLNYSDVQKNENDLHQSLISVTEIENYFKLNKSNKINIGLNYTNETGISTSFPEHKNRERTSFFGSYKYSSKKIKTVLSIRDEMINYKNSTPTFSFGFDVSLSKSFTLRGNVSRNYRIPTFNDLYWTSWGNPNLVPEHGWGEELGLNIHLGQKNIPTFSLTFFNNNIKDWIIWLPDSTWHPHNLNIVWSRGIESNLDYSFHLNKITFNFSAYYTYTLTTNETKNNRNVDELHKQLINIPKHKFNANLVCLYKNFSLTMTELYLGIRYSDAANEFPTDPYSVSNIIIEQKINCKNFILCLNARMNNMFNQSYDIIKNYPMPMRNFQAGIKIIFKKNIN